MIYYTDKENQAFEISDEDYDIVSKYKWHLTGKYIRNTKGVYLHRLLTNAPKEMDVDHIDRNPLNNKRENLRVVTRAENNNNKSKFNFYPNKSTGIYGIDIVPSGRKDKKSYYRVRIKGLKVNKFSKLIKAIKYRNEYFKLHPDILQQLEKIYDKELFK